MPQLPQISPGIRAQSAAVRAIAYEHAAIVSRAQFLAAAATASARSNGSPTT
jgi:hypothetical protein